MKMEEFTKVLAALLKEGVKNCEVTSEIIQRNNGVKRQALLIREDGKRTAPVFYMDKEYERYKDGETIIEEIAETIIRQYEELSETPFENLEDILSGQDVIERITIRLLNMQENQRMIE